MKYRSPYTGRIVSAATHKRQVKAAEGRKARWDKAAARAGRGLERTREGSRAEERARGKLGDALYRQYHALNDLAKLREQEPGAKDFVGRLDVDRRRIAQDYDDHDVPFEYEQDDLMDEIEGDEFEFRVESEGDTGDAT